MLIFTSGIKIEKLNEKVVEYAKIQMEKYESIKTPVVKLLSEFPVMQRLSVIKYDVHFRVFTTVTVSGKTEKQLRFNKDVILTLINKYYAGNNKKNR